MTKLAVTEAELAAKAVAPRVTQDDIIAMLKRVTYITVERPGGSTSTFVHAYLDGKFHLATGMSACVDPANFDADIGLRIASEDARKKAAAALWGFEGYALFKALNPAPTTYIERMQEELDENAERLAKLTAFLDKGRPGNITQEDWEDLLEQLNFQSGYVIVLKRRLDKALSLK